MRTHLARYNQTARMLALLPGWAWRFFFVAALPKRFRRPYKVVGHCLDTGMVKVRWRDQPNRTYLYPRDRVPSREDGRAAR